ncbi:MAG: hypothetical protein D6809_04270 [Gammaproteobacteria bacterium]|nr:MAG: hypothetical protein D6809_04270 [Gammaproteobacteria bacterium]
MQHGLSYEDHLPVRWVAGPVPEAEGTRTRLEEENEQALRALALLEERLPERPAEGGGEEHAQPAAQELARVEAKLNLILALVGQLVARDRAVPPARPVRLGADGLSWEAEGPVPAPGERGLVEVYPVPRWPQPLRLPARVVAVEPVGEGRHRVCVHYEAMGETAREALEKLVFRHHRRSVARARHLAQEGPPEGA